MSAVSVHATYVPYATYATDSRSKFKRYSNRSSEWDERYVHVIHHSVGSKHLTTDDKSDKVTCSKFIFNV